MSTDDEETIMYPSPKRYIGESTKFSFSVPPPPIPSRKRTAAVMPNLYTQLPLKMVEESDDSTSPIPPPPPPPPPPQAPKRSAYVQTESLDTTPKRPRIHMTQRQLLFTRDPGTIVMKMCSTCYKRSKTLEKPAEDVYSIALCSICSKKNLELRFD